MMKFSGKGIRKKIRDRSGETLLEVLAGLLIAALHSGSFRKSDKEEQLKDERCIR